MSKKLEPPNYTQIPNALLDRLGDFTDSELRVMLCACRQTFGWHRDDAKMSLTFIAQGSGLTKQGAINGIKGLLSAGFMDREKDGESWRYSVAVEHVPPVNGVDHPSQRRLPPLVNGVDHPPVNGVDPNKETNINKKGDSPKRAVTDAWCEAYQKQFGGRYSFQGAKDGRAADSLIAAGMTSDDVVELARLAWMQVDQRTHWACVNQSQELAKFAAAINSIRAELKRNVGGANGHSARQQSTMNFSL